MRHVETGRISMPALGLGTFRLEGRQARDMTERALAEGYRHVDTARMYGNEAAIGAGITRAGVPREEIFVTTKVWPDDFRRTDFERAVADSLRNLRSDHVDLLLLHWPSRAVPLEETIDALSETVRRGQARYAGVSNFTRGLFEQAEAASAVSLAVNQVECHPYLDQSAMRAFLERRGAAMTAYCPLALGAVADDPVIIRIAERHGASVAQVTLAWILSAPNTAAIPKTANPGRLAENLAASELALAPEEIAGIDRLARPDGRILSPAGLAPAWD